MTATKPSLAARWWFLTPHGFEKFKEHPPAQGYEIICRHSLCPTLKVHPRAKGIAWEHGSTNPKPTWEHLPTEAQSAFLFDYKYELRRMGLHEVAWAGPKAVTFDCTDGWPSIEAAVRFQLKRAVSGGWIRIETFGYRRTICRSTLKLSLWPERTTSSKSWFQPVMAQSGNQDIVTVHWGALIHGVGGLGIDNVLGALRTFVEHDPEYIEYRRQRVLDSGRRIRLRPKKTNPAHIALACAILDCYDSGLDFQDNITTSHLGALGIRLNDFVPSKAKNWVRRIKEMWLLAGFRTPHHAKPAPMRAKTLPKPIIVGLILNTGSFVHPPQN